MRPASPATRAGDAGDVGLRDLPALELPAEVALGEAGAGEDDDAGGVAVETVDEQGLGEGGAQPRLEAVGRPGGFAGTVSRPDGLSSTRRCASACRSASGASGASNMLRAVLPLSERKGEGGDVQADSGAGRSRARRGRGAHPEGGALAGRRRPGRSRCCTSWTSRRPTSSRRCRTTSSRTHRAETRAALEALAAGPVRVDRLLLLEGNAATTILAQAEADEARRDRARLAPARLPRLPDRLDRGAGGAARRLHGGGRALLARG